MKSYEEEDNGGWWWSRRWHWRRNCFLGAVLNSPREAICHSLTVAVGTVGKGVVPFSCPMAVAISVIVVISFSVAVLVLYLLWHDRYLWEALYRAMLLVITMVVLSVGLRHFSEPIWKHIVALVRIISPTIF